MSDTEPNQSCTECDRINCNGVVHECSEDDTIYPICDNCGVELCDLIELLENPDIRSEAECEICLLPYDDGVADSKNHFASHFQPNNDCSEKKFFCLSCIDGVESTEEEYVSYDDIVHQEDEEDLDNGEPVRKKRRKLPKIDYVFKGYSSSDDVDTSGDAAIFQKAEKSFRCSQCQRSYGTSLELMFHENNFHNTFGPGEYDCPLCDKICSTKNVRAAHVNATHRDPDTGLLPCPYCDKEIKNICIMEDHIIVHSDKLPFICDLCGKGFRRLGNLQGHYATHNANDSYACFKCPKTFKTEQLRKKHIRHVHVDEKPLKCEQCDKRYKDHSDLRRHRWTHGGFEKKFQCTLCNMKFFENKCLRIHMKTHFKKKREASDVSEFYESVASNSGNNENESSNGVFKLIKTEKSKK